MATPVGDSYAVASGGVIAGGRSAPARNPDAITSSWPLGANCSIPAVAGVNAPIHPKVLDTVSGWNGYRYWMAFTPYPSNNDDSAENPSVVASHDGDTWVAPATNPIEPAPSGVQNGVKYNSDTHLLLISGVMYLVWRLYDNSNNQWIERLLYRTSANGTTWSASAPVNLQTTNASGQKSLLLSPAIEYFNGQFYCWTCRRDTSPVSCELRTAPAINGPWSAPQACSLALADTLREPWHLDVVRIPNGWAMLISDRRRSDGAVGRLLLAYANSAGINWTPMSAPFSTGAPAIYRSSLVRSGSGFDCWVTDNDARRIRRLRINDSQV